MPFGRALERKREAIMNPPYAIGEKLLFIEVTYDAKSVIVSIKKNKSKLICHRVEF